MKTFVAVSLTLSIFLLVTYLFLLKFDTQSRTEYSFTNLNGNTNGSNSGLSMKYIDSLTAEMNLRFTIRNAVGYKSRLIFEEVKSE